jgi:hypothetical protein
MPESFVRRLAWCCVATILVFPAVGLRIALLDWKFSFVADIAIAAIWVAGSMLVTIPIRSGEARKYGLGERGKLRQVARWCSLGAFGVAVASNYNVLVMLIPSLIVTSTGLFCLFLLLAGVADWARDARAKKWLEYAAWGTPFLFLLARLLLLFMPPVFSMFVDLLAIAFLLLGISGMFILASSVLKSVQHAREYQEYQERRVKKNDSTDFPYPK